MLHVIGVAFLLLYIPFVAVVVCYELKAILYVFAITFHYTCFSMGRRGSSAVERATPGEEVPGSIPAVAARSLQLGRCLYNVTG